MKTMVIPSPGVGAGPCDGYCRHDHCHLFRYVALTSCLACHGRIGYDQGFCCTWAGYVHAACQSTKVDSEAVTVVTSSS